MPVTILTEEKFCVSEDTVIWRYMDLSKYLSLLTKRKLWFTRISEFRKTDPYEGGFTNLDYNILKNVFRAKNKEELLLILKNYGFDQDIHFVEQYNKSLAYYQFRFFKNHTYFDGAKPLTSFASCWHENTGESDAMWALYAQRDAGIAIRTTVRRLCDAFASSGEDMAIGRINYDSDIKPLSAISYYHFTSLLIKRHAFHHEKEIRLIATNYDDYKSEDFSEENKSYKVNSEKKVPPGIEIDCDLELLSEEIVLSPMMSPHLASSIIEVTKKFFENCPIRYSNLLTMQDDKLELSPDFLEIADQFRKTGLMLDKGEGEL